MYIHACIYTHTHTHTMKYMEEICGYIELASLSMFLYDYNSNSIFIKLYRPTRPHAGFQNVLANGVASRVLVSVSFLGSNLKVDAKPQKLGQSKEMQLAHQSVSERLIFVIIHDSVL